MSAVSDQVRKEFKMGDDIRDAGLCAPEGIERFDDIIYGPDEFWQRLDLYRPKAAGDGILPVIVSVHGGGWVYGDKERYQYYAMSLAEHGFAVVNFTYRLAPEFKFPSSLEDTNMVFGWVVENAERFGLDCRNVFAVGDSAGAHLLGLYSAFLTNADYASCYPFLPATGFTLMSIALNCGVYSIKDGDLRIDERTRALLQDLLPDGGSPKELELIDVTRHVTSSYPVTFVMTSTGDFLRSQAPLMVLSLEKADVEFSYRVYGNRNDRLPHDFHCDMRRPEAASCNAEECDFFRRLVRPR